MHCMHRTNNLFLACDVTWIIYADQMRLMAVKISWELMYLSAKLLGFNTISRVGMEDA